MSTINYATKCTSNSSSIILNKLTKNQCQNDQTSYQDIDILGDNNKRNKNYLNISYQPIIRGLIPESTSNSLADLNNVQIPESFSWLQKGGNKIEDGRRNQSSCGCCWAMSVISVLGDRYALKYNIEAPYPSVTNLVSCGGPWVGSKSVTGNFISAKNQCSCGGVTSAGATWLETNNVVSEQCWPFSTITVNKHRSSNGATVNVAPDCVKDLGDGCCVGNNGVCCNKSVSPKFGVKPNSIQHILKYKDNKPLLDETIAAIKLEIMNGPVSTTIFVPPNFQEWWNSYLEDGPYNSELLTDDVFVPTTSPTADGHAMVLTGWGKDKKGTNYWEVRNSWGSPDYAYIAMSTEYSPEYYFGIDIPIIPPGTTADYDIESYSGGVLSFQAGDLDPTIKKNTGKGSSPTEHKFLTQTRKPNYFIISMIGVFLLICVILCII